MSEEKWKKLPSCPRYEISTLGQVRNSDTNHVMSPRLDRYGYLRLSLSDRGKKIYKTVHRAVAETWIPNPSNLPQVNHINGNKTHNCVRNLEWSTPKENIVHSFVFLLNKNTTPIRVRNVETDEVVDFRSIKDLGRTIGISVSTIYPLILNSARNPILGKYVVTVLDEAVLQERSNTENFGKEIHVYDEITEKVKTYASVNIASYYTGVRSLSNLKKSGNIIRSIGYQVTADKGLIDYRVKIDKEVVLREREAYILTPYRNRSVSYYAYNYWTKEEFVFDSYKAIVEFFDKVEPIGPFRRNAFSSALHCAAKEGRNGLYKGYGVHSGFHYNGWFPFTEEALLSSRNGLPQAYVYYRVFHEGKSELVLGKIGLCRKFGYYPDKLSKGFNIERFIRSLNIPNLRVDRLNKPLP